MEFLVKIYHVNDLRYVEETSNNMDSLAIPYGVNSVPSLHIDTIHVMNFSRPSPVSCV